MLQAAIDAEVDEFLARHADRRDEQGRRLVVRNGRLPSREILTGAGRLDVSQPRVRDKSPDQREPRDVLAERAAALPEAEQGDRGADSLAVSQRRFPRGTSRRHSSRWSASKPRDSVRTSSFGSRRPGARSTTSGCIGTCHTSHYVYIWADGIHANVRLEDDANKKQCLLVLMGATASMASKELIAVVDGYRESKQSWRELLLELEAARDGSGRSEVGRRRWSARLLGRPAGGVRPATDEQRCWVHKTANVLNKHAQERPAEGQSRSA